MQLLVSVGRSASIFKIMLWLGYVFYILIMAVPCGSIFETGDWVLGILVLRPKGAVWFEGKLVAVCLLVCCIDWSYYYC